MRTTPAPARGLAAPSPAAADAALVSAALARAGAAYWSTPARSMLAYSPGSGCRSSAPLRATAAATRGPAACVQIVIRRVIVAVRIQCVGHCVHLGLQAARR